MTTKAYCLLRVLLLNKLLEVFETKLTTVANIQTEIDEYNLKSMPSTCPKRRGHVS
jgi:hypothetical protein